MTLRRFRPPRWGGGDMGATPQGFAPLHPGLSPCAALRRGVGLSGISQWAGWSCALAMPTKDLSAAFTDASSGKTWIYKYTFFR